VRDDLLARAPDLKEICKAVTDKLTTEELTNLNQQVGVDHEDPDKVAAAWLEAQGIPAAAARHYVASMFAGLAAATRSGEPFAALAADHATPGGLNEQVLSGLEAHGTFARVDRELQRVLDRLTG
jgi:hypothetical protein